MQHMIVHHRQAVDMSALIAERTNHKGITLIGKRITLSQDAEIAMMKTWLKRRGHPEMDPDMHAHHGHQLDPDQPVMTGMLSLNEMKALDASNDKDFERLYLLGMIKHHQGALIWSGS